MPELNATKSNHVLNSWLDFNRKTDYCWLCGETEDLAPMEDVLCNYHRLQSRWAKWLGNSILGAFRDISMILLGVLGFIKELKWLNKRLWALRHECHNQYRIIIANQCNFLLYCGEGLLWMWTAASYSSRNTHLFILFSNFRRTTKEIRNGSKQRYQSGKQFSFIFVVATRTLYENDSEYVYWNNT